VCKRVRKYAHLIKIIVKSLRSGYVELVDRVRLSWVKDHPRKNNWHWSPRWGSPEDASDYCKKESDWWSVGEMAGKGGGAEQDKWHIAANRIRTHEDWEDVLRDGALARYVAKALNWAAAES
jgi:hypothetical protein